MKYVIQRVSIPFSFLVEWGLKSVPYNYQRNLEHRSEIKPHEPKAA